MGGRTCVDINAKVLAGAVLEGVLLAQLVEHVGGVEAGVVAELTRDDLQGARECDHEQLLPPRNRARMVSQPPAQSPSRTAQLLAIQTSKPV